MHGSTPDADELAALVRRVILRHWPDRFNEADLTDDVLLGSGGLGFDSIELAEVILGCEEESGAAVNEELFDEGSLTIRVLAGHLNGP